LTPVDVGIIGCGNISATYLTAAKYFPVLNLRAVADINLVASKLRSSEFGIPATSVQEVLNDKKIEIVINLTVPKAHVDVGMQAIAAGKHVHSEKPLGITVAEAMLLRKAAAAKSLRLGCAPDTFLGGAQQTCRKLIDEGAIGRVVAGTAFFLCPGHETWHPNPGFYYLKGGGPVFDMAPYYVTTLVNLLGPIKRVTSLASRSRSERVVKTGSLAGKNFPVEIDTHVSGMLEFVEGAIVTIVMSFDVVRHGHRPIELYGTKGTLLVPDPDFFGGQIEISHGGADWEIVPTEFPYADRDYRIIGVADLAHALRENRPHRASGDLAFHVLEVMEALHLSSDRAVHIEISSRIERPAAMPGVPM
jgi:hypothetical protein